MLGIGHFCVHRYVYGQVSLAVRVGTCRWIVVRRHLVIKEHFSWTSSRVTSICLHTIRNCYILMLNNAIMIMSMVFHIKVPYNSSWTVDIKIPRLSIRHPHWIMQRIFCISKRSLVRKRQHEHLTAHSEF